MSCDSFLIRVDKSFIISDKETYHSPKGLMTTFEETIAEQKTLEFEEGIVEENRY